MNQSNIFGVFLALFFLLFQARAPAAHCQLEYSEPVQYRRYALGRNGFVQHPSLQESLASELHSPPPIILNPYEEALENMKDEERDRQVLSSGTCLNSSFASCATSLVSHAAEQGEIAQMQKCANHIANAPLGSVNFGCSAGWCHCYKREVVRDSFCDIVLLLMKWISELVAGYYSEILYGVHVLSLTHILWASRPSRKY